MSGSTVTGIDIHASADNFIVTNNDLRTDTGTPFTNSATPSKIFANNIS